MRTEIKPQAEPGDVPFRFNFITPFLLSSYNPNTLYLGAQKVLKTTDRGDNWRAISPDLTQDENIAAISSIAESPTVQGLLYSGTEDGNVYVSQDDGALWTDLTANFPGLPKDRSGRFFLHGSRLEASHFEPGTVYASFDGHGMNDFHAYIFRTVDYGKT